MLKCFKSFWKHDQKMSYVKLFWKQLSDNELCEFGFETCSEHGLCLNRLEHDQTLFSLKIVFEK